MLPATWMANLWRELFPARSANPRRGTAEMPALRVRRLEPRRVLNGAPLLADALLANGLSNPADQSTPWMVSAADLANHSGSGATDIHLLRDGDQYAVTIDGVIAARHAVAGVDSIQIAGTSGNDRFTLDAGIADSLSQGGVLFLGGAGDDSLTVTGSNLSSAGLELRAGAGGELTWGTSRVALDSVESLRAQVRTVAWNVSTAVPQILSVEGDSDNGSVRLTAAGLTQVELAVPSRSFQVTADQLELTGRLEIAGGTIDIQSRHDVSLTAGANWNAAGGHVRLAAGPEGTTWVGGVVDVSSSTGVGGTIELLGGRVGVEGTARLDASGAVGGGRVRIGGEPTLAGYGGGLSTRVAVADGATILANAGLSGDGGRVVVWSSEVTRFGGAVEVRGGAFGGNGGFVETSGLDRVQFTGTLDLGATHGKSGTFLLDPKVIRIRPGISSVNPPVSLVNFADLPDDLTIFDLSLEAVKSGTILLQATDAIFIEDLFQSPQGGGDGALNLSNDVNLILQTRNGAGDDANGGIQFINPLNSIVAQGTGRITLQAGVAADASGNVSAFQGSASANLGGLFAGAGGIRVQASGNVVETSVIKTDAEIELRADADGNGVGSVVVGIDALIESGGTAANTILLQGADIELLFADTPPSIATTSATGGVSIRSSLASRPINLGGSANLVVGINLTDDELDRIAVQPHGSLTIGDAIQNGDIVITTAKFANSPSANLFVQQNPGGTGAIVLNDESGSGPALDGNGGGIALLAGTGGVRVVLPANNQPELATNGPFIRIDTAGGIGTLTHPLQLADNASQSTLVEIGTALRPKGPVNLDGLGSLAFGRILLSHSDLVITAQGSVVQSAPWEGRNLSVTTFADSGGNIDVSNSDNQFDAIDLETFSANGITLSPARIDYQDGDGIVINAIRTAGSVGVIARGVLSQTGPIVADQLHVETRFDTGADIVLSNVDNAVRGASLLVADSTGDQLADGTIRFVESDGFDAGLILTLGDISLETGGPVQLVGEMRGRGLELLGAGSYLLTSDPAAQTVLDIDLLAADVTGGVVVSDINDLTVGTVFGTTGVRTTAAGSDVRLTAGNLLKLASRVEVELADVDLTAPHMIVSASISTDGGTVRLSSPDGIVPSDVQFDANVVIDTEQGDDNAAGTVDLSQTSLSAIGAGIRVSIDTSTAPEFLGGNILFADLGSQGGNFLNDFVLKTNAGTNPDRDQVFSFGKVRVNNSLVIERAQFTTLADLVGSGNLVRIVSDGLTINAQLGAANLVEILAATPGRTMDLGTTSSTVLGIGDVDLGLIATPHLRLGSATTGPITVSRRIDFPNVGVLDLVGGADMTNLAGGSLVVHDLVIQTPGTVVLSGDNQVVNLAAAVGGPFTFHDTANLTIGSVLGVQGISTTAPAGDVNLSSDASLFINESIQAGPATVRLLAHERITQGGNGVIHARKLGVVKDQSTVGFVSLRLPNEVTTFAGFSAVGDIEFANAGPLELGSIGSAGSAGIPAITGVVAADGDVRLQTDGALTQTAFVQARSFTVVTRDDQGADVVLNDPGNQVQNLKMQSLNAAGTALTAGDLNLSNNGFLNLTSIQTRGTARLTSTVGVAQSGAIQATSLSVTTVGGSFGVIALDRTDNDVDFVELRTLSTNGQSTGFGSIQFSDADGFVVLGLESLGSAELWSGGTASQSGSIRASKLLLRGPGSFEFLREDNQINVLAASTGGSVYYRDTDDFTVGGVQNTSGILVADDGASVELHARGQLALNEQIQAARGDVRLKVAGQLTQSLTGSIVAKTLGVRQTAGTVEGVTLAADNQVAVLAIDSESGDVEFHNTANLVIGNVVGGPTGLFNPLLGVTVGTGRLFLTVDGALDLQSRVSDPTGIVRMRVSGPLTQVAGGEITAEGLSVVQRNPSGGDVSLAGANAIQTVAIENNGAGSRIDVRSTVDLVVTSIDGDSGRGFSPVSGLRSTQGEITVQSGGSLELLADVQAGSANVLLSAEGGLTESGGAITADGLGVRVNGGNTDVFLSSNNAIRLFAIEQLMPGIGVSLHNNGDLEIGQIAGGPASGFAPIVGVRTQGGPVVLDVAGQLILSEAVNAGPGTVNLFATGAIVDGNGDAVDLVGSELHVIADALGTSGDPLESRVAVFEADVGDGGIHLINDGSLRIGGEGLTAVAGGIELLVDSSVPGFIPELIIQATVTHSQFTAPIPSPGMGPNGGGGISPQGVTPGIQLISTGNLMVVSPIRNLALSGSGAGDILLSSGKDLTLIDTGLDGDIFTVSGSVAISYGGNSNFVQQYPNLTDGGGTNSFQITTPSATLVAAPPFVNVVITQPTAMGGPTTFQVTVGRTGEKGLMLAVDYADGVVETYPIDATNGPVILTLSHTYTQPTQGTLDYLPTFTVMVDPSVSIIDQTPAPAGLVGIPGTEDANGVLTQGFVVAGDGNQGVTRLVARVTFTAPGGGGGTNPGDLNPGDPPRNIGLVPPGVVVMTPLPEPDPPARNLEEPDDRPRPLPPPENVAALGQSNQGAQIVASNSGDTITLTSIDRFVIREVAADGADLRTIDLEVFRLGEKTLDPQLIRDQIFPKLPDGRYRVVWLRGTSSGDPVERVVLDVFIRGGRPVFIQDLQRPVVVPPMGEVDTSRAVDPRIDAGTVNAIGETTDEPTTVAEEPVPTDNSAPAESSNQTSRHWAAGTAHAAVALTLLHRRRRESDSNTEPASASESKATAPESVTTARYSKSGWLARQLRRITQRNPGEKLP